MFVWKERIFDYIIDLNYIMELLNHLRITRTWNTKYYFLSFMPKGGNKMLLEKVLSNYPKRKDYLLESLIDVDEKKVDHYITEEEIKRIANYFETKESHVCSVMSFYTLLSTKPRGKYIVQVCKDVPCYVNDTFNVLKTVEEFLGIQLGETSNDNLFTIEFTACIGCCDESPAMRINHETYTNLTKGKVITLLEQYKEDSHDTA